MDDIKKKRTMREESNAALGIKVDVDFQAMVEQQQENVSLMQSVSHISTLIRVSILDKIGNFVFFSCYSISQQTSLRSTFASRSDLFSSLSSLRVKST